MIDCVPSTTIQSGACDAHDCRLKCSLEVVDGLLSTEGAVTGEEVDLLLDFRHLLRAREDAEGTLRLFCELRRRLEARQYLAFYRLRRWLGHHVVATVQSCQAAEPVKVRVKLEHYCVEAIRRVALCQGLGRGNVLLAPRVQFSFVGQTKAMEGNRLKPEQHACVG